MISVSSVNPTNPKETHTIQDFIRVGKQNRDYFGYDRLAYMETIDGIEYIVKNIIDEYQDELSDISKTIKLSHWAVTEFQYNPKKLSNRLYKTTRLWHMLLRLNGMGNVHDFDLENHKLVVVEPVDMINFMSKVFNAENLPLQIYKNAHSKDQFPEDNDRYRPIEDPSRKFLYF